MELPKDLRFVPLKYDGFPLTMPLRKLSPHSRLDGTIAPQCLTRLASDPSSAFFAHAIPHRAA